MQEVTLLDPVSGIGAIAPISQFADITPNPSDPENLSDYVWKNGYVARLVDPIAALLGFQRTPARFAKAIAAAGIEEAEVLVLVARLPEVPEGGGFDIAAVEAMADELWVVAFHHAGNGENLDLRTANLIRVL